MCILIISKTQFIWKQHFPPNVWYWFTLLKAVKNDFSEKEKVQLEHEMC